MKVLTYNILEGGVGRIDPLAEVIRGSGADVVVLQETWDGDLFQRLADRVGMDRFLTENPKNPHGAVGLLTRWEIVEAANHAPLEPRLTRSAFTTTVRQNRGAPELSILGLHLHARETFADEAIRLKEVEGVLDIAKALPHPHLLAGDFNTSHPQQQINIDKLSPKRRERIKPQHDQLPREVITRVLGAGYLDIHALTRPPANFNTSFTTADPAMRVDFIFASPDLAPRLRACDVYKPEIARFASDHYPVLAEMDF